MALFFLVAAAKSGAWEGARTIRLPRCASQTPTPSLQQAAAAVLVS